MAQPELWKQGMTNWKMIVTCLHTSPSIVISFLNIIQETLGLGVRASEVWVRVLDGCSCCCSPSNPQSE